MLFATVEASENVLQRDFLSAGYKAILIKYNYRETARIPKTNIVNLAHMQKACQVLQRWMLSGVKCQNMLTIETELLHTVLFKSFTKLFCSLPSNQSRFCISCFKVTYSTLLISAYRYFCFYLENSEQ